MTSRKSQKILVMRITAGYLFPVSYKELGSADSVSLDTSQDAANFDQNFWFLFLGLLLILFLFLQLETPWIFLNTAWGSFGRCRNLPVEIRIVVAKERVALFFFIIFYLFIFFCREFD